MGIFSKLFAQPEEIDPNALYAPMAGKTVPVSQVPDDDLIAIQGKGE